MPTPEVLYPIKGIPILKFSEPSITSMTEANCLDFFSLSKFLDPLKHFPEGVENDVSYINFQFRIFKQKNLMLRQPFCELVEQIPKHKLVYVDGLRGIGKSVALMFAAAALKSDNAIVLYVPRVHDYIVGKYHYLPADSDYDIPEASVHILGYLCTHNQEILKSIKAQETTLWDVVQKGLEQPEKASEVLKDTIQVLSTQKEFPVYIFIDQANSLFSETRYKKQNGALLKVHRFLPLKILQNLVSGETMLENGSVVCSKSRQYRNTIATPYNDLVKRKTEGKDCMEFVVPAYSIQEMRSIINYYRRLGHTFQDDIEGDYLEGKYFVTGGIGRKLFEACKYDNIYF